jgi:hypothetical protein
MDSLEAWGNEATQVFGKSPRPGHFAEKATARPDGVVASSLAPRVSLSSMWLQPNVRIAHVSLRQNSLRLVFSSFARFLQNRLLRALRPLVTLFQANCRLTADD